MSIQQMREQIIEHVSAVNDENILKMIDEELAFYLKYKEDPALLLAPEDLEELKMLEREPFEKDTMSFDEFKKIMDEWRMK